MISLRGSDISSAGLEVVRVIIPGLVPNFTAAFPTLGHNRLRQAPVDLGLLDRPLDLDEINWQPLPHA